MAQEQVGNSYPGWSVSAIQQAAHEIYLNDARRLRTRSGECKQRPPLYQWSVEKSVMLQYFAHERVLSLTKSDIHSQLRERRCPLNLFIGEREREAHILMRALPKIILYENKSR